MPVGGVVAIRLFAPIVHGEVERWTSDLLEQFCADDFVEPFKIVSDIRGGELPVEDGSVWCDLGVFRVYYGKGYERGELGWFIELAEWLESHIQGCEVWYGHDADEDALRPFGFNERVALLDYYRQVGHEPYLNQIQGTERRLSVPEKSQFISIRRIEASAVGVVADLDHGEGWIAFHWIETPSGGLKIDLDGHCSRDMPIRSGNGPPEFVELRRDAIRLRFDAELARKLELPEEIEIKFRISEDEFAKLQHVVDWFNDDGEFAGQ
jgi:hypothetical protein